MEYIIYFLEKGLKLENLLQSYCLLLSLVIQNKFYFGNKKYKVTISEPLFRESCKVKETR